MGGPKLQGMPLTLPLKFKSSSAFSGAARFAALLSTPCAAQMAPSEGAPAAAALAPATPLAHVHVDLPHHEVDIDCQALRVGTPLEFFCVIDGGNEHESVLRTPAKPSDIHFALLMLGLKPGAPATFDGNTQRWIPPHGAAVHVLCRFELHGKTVELPAYRMMRSVKTRQEMRPTYWVFDGSRIMPDGTYAADVTGYVVSICNFDLTMVDVPALVSNSNETLEWEINPELVPPRGSPVTMVITPAPDVTTRPADAGSLPVQAFDPGPGLSGGGGPAIGDVAPTTRETTPSATSGGAGSPTTAPAGPP